MSKPVVVISSDHAGVEMKSLLKDALAEWAANVIDLGTNNSESVDYPDYANAVAHVVLKGDAQYGVAICGSGIGMSMALNRHKGIRAALCADGLWAKLSRRHNNANVLCLGARLTGIEEAKDCVRQFFTTPFEGGRHEKRIQKMDN